MQQQVADLCADVLGHTGDGPFTITELATLLLPGLGALDVAVAPQLPDLLGQRVDPGPDLVALGGDLPELLVELEDTGQFAIRGRVAAAGESGSDTVVVGANAADIDHGAEP